MNFESVALIVPIFGTILVWSLLLISLGFLLGKWVTARRMKVQHQTEKELAEEYLEWLRFYDH